MRKRDVRRFRAAFPFRKAFQIRFHFHKRPVAQTASHERRVKRRIPERNALRNGVGHPSVTQPTRYGFCGTHMTLPSPQDVTQLLLDWNSGDPVARERLIQAVYDELHRLAHSYLRRERVGGSLLQTTALVHEAYIRLVGGTSVQWQSRAHFFGIAANLMRQILVDEARARQANKRGGDALRVSIDGALNSPMRQAREILAVNDALEALARRDPRQSQIVEMRFFGGMTEEEIGETLGINPRTVRREWSVARAWLLKELGV